MKTEYSLNKVLTGVTGEYYVAAELSRLGHLASITLRNTKGVDILCSNAEASKSVGIQVKSKLGTERSWILNSKCEDYFADSLFYVFVNISPDITQKPEFTIVPSKVVAKQAKESHAEWLSGTKKSGEARKDSAMRKFTDREQKYLDRWDLLGLSS